MWTSSVVLTLTLFCRLTATGDDIRETTTEIPSTSSSLMPVAPVYLRLGNYTIDSTKSFKVPQPSQDTVTKLFKNQPQTTRQTIVTDIIPQVVQVPKHTYFDHDRRYGPNFEDSDGNVTKVTVQLGEDANLNCRISLLQDKTVSWVRRRVKDEIPELLTVGAVTYAADRRIDVGKRYPGNWRLLIKSVKPDDEGVYECQISTHPPRVSKTYLRVNTPQVWVVDEAGAPLAEKYYEAASTLALLCRVRHVDPPVVLTWLHEGKALNEDTTRGGISVKTEQVLGGADSQLLVARVTGSDAGNYTCAVRGAGFHIVAVHVLNGAGSGVGRSACAALSREGATVVATDTNYEAARETLSVHTALSPGENALGDHSVIKMDVSRYSDVQNALQEVLSRYHTAPSIIVNTASVTRDKLLLDMTEDDFDSVLSVNLKGTFLVMQAFGRAMTKVSIHGTIINISSIIGKYGHIGQTSFSGSKAGIVSMTQTAAKELGKYNIRVNAILPGFLDTPFMRTVPRTVLKELLKHVPMGRLGDPKEVAEMVVFLSSDKSSFMTGAAIEVCGGY